MDDDTAATDGDELTVGLLLLSLSITERGALHGHIFVMEL